MRAKVNWMLSFSRGYIALHLALAGLAVGIGILDFILQERFNRKAILTHGTIEGFDCSTMIVRYSDTRGGTYTLRTTDWSGVDRSKPMPLLYDRDNPSDAKLKGSRAHSPFVMVLTGLLSLIHLPYWEFRLRRWARRNDCELVKVRPVFMWNNPFGPGSAVSNSLITFDVDVIDDEGKARRSWVKFGSFWWWSLKVEAVWESDEESLSNKLEERRRQRPRIPTPLERQEAQKR